MKKLLVAFTFALVLLTSCNNQGKITFVNIEEVLKGYEGAKDAEKEIKAQSDALTTELEKIQASFQVKVQDYQSNLKKNSEADNKAKEQELMQEQQLIQQRQQMVQQQMQAEGQKKFQEINEQIDAFLVTYAKSKSYAYILGTSDQTKSVFYGDGSLDVTEDLLEALNEDYLTETETETVEVVEETITVVEDSLK